MILKASQRGGAVALAKHLLNANDNDHVELHGIRGVACDTLIEAFREIELVAKGTRCRQMFFTVSLNPPQDASVPVQVFEKAISKIEKSLGLKGQPRAIVFHEKLGRRHAHVVWSRIDATTMRAKNLPHFKRQMRSIAREMFFEQGWDNIPQGLLDGPSDPLNYSVKEWQAAKKRGVDPKTQKAAIQEAWAVSDSGESFIAALKERGFLLARGDRRSFVLLSHQGEILSLPRALGRKTKEVKARLGDPSNLLDLATAASQLKAHLRTAFGRMAQDIRRDWQAKQKSWEIKRQDMKMEHRWHRRQLDQELKKQREAEVMARAARLHKGLRGLWQRVTGAHRRIVAENKAEAAEAEKRDLRERQAMIDVQLKKRRDLERTRAQDLIPEKANLRQLREERDSIWEKLAAKPKPSCRSQNTKQTRAAEITYE